MTLKQGDDINKSYIKNQKNVDSLNDLVISKNALFDSLKLELSKTDRKKEEYKVRYEERLNMPTKVKYQYHDDGWDFTEKIILIGIIVIQFFKIKR